MERERALRSQREGFPASGRGTTARQQIRVRKAKVAKRGSKQLVEPRSMTVALRAALPGGEVAGGSQGATLVGGAGAVAGNPFEETECTHEAHANRS